MRACLALLLVAFTLQVAHAAPKVLFENFKIHTVVTKDNVGLKVAELLGPNSIPMIFARPIVLMHGYTSNWNSWHLIADQYRKAGLRVFIVNWRGHGQGVHRSVVLGEPFNTHDPRYNFHQLATQDVPAVIDFAYRLSGGKKVIYQSHSMGGMMANLAFSGVTTDHNSELTVSLARGKSFESKVFAYIPVAAPNSLRFKGYPGADLLVDWMGGRGINGDRSDSVEYPFARTRMTALYWAIRANPFYRGLINAHLMNVDEFTALLNNGASDVPRALSDHMLEMRRDFYGPADRSLDYEAISQDRATTPYYRTSIPILMITAVTDVLALVELQDALAKRRACQHVRIGDAGHMDIVFGKKGANRVVSETLKFVGAIL